MCMSRRAITNRQLRAKVSAYPPKRNPWSMFLHTKKRVFTLKLTMESLLMNKDPNPSGLLNNQDTFPLFPAKVGNKLPNPFPNPFPHPLHNIAFKLPKLPNPYNNKLPNNITSPRTCVSIKSLRTSCLSTRPQCLNFGRHSLKHIKTQVMQAMSQLMLSRLISLTPLGPLIWPILTPRLDRYSAPPLSDMLILLMLTLPL